MRQALIFKSKSHYPNIDLESNVYAAPPEDTLAEAFARQFTQQQGQFVYCDNQYDCIDKLISLIEMRRWKHVFCWEDEIQQLLRDSGIGFNDKKEQLEKVQAGITGCEALIARTGSILVSSSRNSRTLTIWPPTHIVISKMSQLVMELKDGLHVLKNRYGKNMPSMLSYISGPSRSYDIETKMVIGSHGPTELILFMIDDSKKEA